MQLYQGTKLPNTSSGLKPYFPAPKLVQAVNYAIVLKRPLLLKGEPGCGKTLLAKAVADELGAYPDRYFEWRIKSTSKAQEGLYTFDYLKRLHDVQISSKSKNASFPLEGYLETGVLYKAFEAAKNNPDKEVVLLIDEIDKADIDFPNDLLHELEEKSIVIHELPSTNSKYKLEMPKQNNLIIFITSNNEKELPAAFLRRCLFHFIEFPNENHLKEIIEGHHPELQTQITQQLIHRFTEIRAQYRTQLPNDKQPSTSELLDWCNLVKHYAQNERKVEEITKDISVLLKSENAIKKIRIGNADE
jgi:MoxR-like ATPase